MKVAVFGGGVIGITTAYYLAKDGHEVEVFERQDRLARDASSGNAGMIAPGHSYSWASPKAPRMLLESLFGAHTAIRVRPRIDPDLVKWGLRFLRECPTSRAERNTAIKLALCQYSQGKLNEILAAENLDIGHASKGLLYLFRDQKELEGGFQRSELLRRYGQKQTTLSAAEVVALEPALAPVEERLAGAVYGVDDSSGDSERFTNLLADRCRELGVRFRLGTALHRFETAGDRVTAAVVDNESVRADLHVLSLGIDSPAVARTAGVKLPMYPAKGYCATFPVSEEHQTPMIAGVDEVTLVAWTNFGDRLRMSSTAEFDGFNRKWRERDFHNIHKMAQELIPKAADFTAGEYRVCLRPMTPGGPPIIGFGKQRNLLYNTGHGHMGWTMASGSARIAADLAAGKQAEIDVHGYEVPV